MMNIKLTRKQEEKLIELGIRSLIDKMDFANFPTPVVTKGRKWSAQQRRRFLATMRKKNAGTKGNS